MYAVWPKRMTTREEKQVEWMNDEFFAVYRRLREDAMKHGAAIKTAAEMQGYGLTRAYEIVNLREGQIL